MKKFLLLSLAALTMMACNKSGEEKGQQLDPDAMISLRPAPGVRADNPVHLSALEIVMQTHAIRWIAGGDSEIGGKAVGRGFSPHQRDTIDMRLLMFGTDIITQFGQYNADFIEGKEVVLTRQLAPELEDTIAYVPKSTLIAAQKIIKPAYDNGDYATCYKTFNEAFTFIPITGAEWLELKAQGKN